MESHCVAGTAEKGRLIGFPFAWFPRWWNPTFGFYGGGESPEGVVCGRGKKGGHSFQFHDEIIEESVAAGSAAAVEADVIQFADDACFDDVAGAEGIFVVGYNHADFHIVIEQAFHIHAHQQEFSGGWIEAHACIVQDGEIVRYPLQAKRSVAVSGMEQGADIADRDSDMVSSRSFFFPADLCFDSE